MNFVYFIWTSALLLLFHSCSICVLSFLNLSFLLRSCVPFQSCLLHCFHFHFLHFYFSHCGSFQATGGPIFRMRSASPANVLLLIVIIFGLSRHVLDIVLSPLWVKADIIM